MTAGRRPALPGGTPPPTTARLPDGTVLELRPLAERISQAHLRRHPEDLERYGAETALAWCTHDHQHLVSWAAEDLALDAQVLWLASVLDARGYPVANLADSLATAAEVIEREIATDAGREVAAKLRAAAAKVTGAPS